MPSRRWHHDVTGGAQGGAAVAPHPSQRAADLDQISRSSRVITPRISSAHRGARACSREQPSSVTLGDAR